MTDAGNKSKPVTRPVRETSIYDTAVGIYPVLLALVVTDPLKDTAEDIVSRPFDGDWSLRLLTCALLILAIMWFHIWVVTFRHMALKALKAPEDNRDAPLPGYGMKDVEGYGIAIGAFWLGGIQLIIFTCLAYSVDSEKRFLWGGIAYSMVILFYTFFSYKTENVKDPQSDAHVWKRPLHSIKLLWTEDRHIALSREDLEGHMDSDSDIRLQPTLARGYVFDMTIAAVVILLSGLLLYFVYIFGSSIWVALIVFSLVTGGAILDYYVYPYFYAF
jgi:hypothetical protein